MQLKPPRIDRVFKRGWLLCAYSFPLAVTIVPTKPEPPPRDQVAQIFASAISTHKFQGAKISDVLLTEAEEEKGFFHYGGEFTVLNAGKSFRCENWSFKIEKIEGHWRVAGLKRGRCND